MFFFAAKGVTPEISDILAAIELEGIGDETSPLVAIFANPTSHPIARLRAIQIAMLRCYQALENMRLCPEDYTTNDARAVSRQFRHLKSLAALEVRQLRQEGAPAPGIGHPMIPKLLDALYTKVTGVIHEALTPEQAKAVEAGLRKALEEDERIPWSPSSGATP